MISRIALLRGVNVAGHAMVSMSKVREVVTALGFGNVLTILQSGNIVFAGSARRGAEIEDVIEKELLARLKVRSDVFVRTAVEWAKIVAGNPFADIAARDPARLVLVALKAVPSAAAAAALQGAVTGPEVVRARGARALH